MAQDNGAAVVQSTWDTEQKQRWAELARIREEAYGRLGLGDPNKPEITVDQIKAKREKAARDTRLHEAENLTLLSGFQSEFWRILKQELLDRRQIAVGTILAFRPDTNNWPGLMAAHAEVKVYEQLLGIETVLKKQHSKE